MKSLTFLARCAIPLALLACAGVAGAQSYPTKPLRLVVPFAPAGPNDILGRLISQKLTEAWGQNVVVENRGGAGGTVGLEAASRLPGDGYAIAMGGSSNLAVAPSLYAKLPYDPIKDFTPIINVAIVPYALAVNPTVPAKNVKELITVASRKAGYLSYGSSGMGSMSSLAAEMLKSMAKVDIVHVPYKGTVPALTDVISGQIDLMLADLAVIKPHSDSGKLRVIGVTGSKRSSAAKDIPTIAESGLPGYELSPWFGVVAPAGVPRDVVAKMNAAIGASLKSADVQQRLGALGYEALGGTAEQFAGTIKADIVKYAKIVKSAGIKADL
jgi:tripartite-type tricarboxylate transporter receptor subunit TctC